MTKLIASSIVIATLVAGAGCKTGSPEVRKSIIAQMQTTKPRLDGCYQIALARNRKLPNGMITVELIAEAGTGRFKNVLIRRDEIQDPQVRQCVITEVGRLKLDKPPSSNTQIPYAFRFTAVN
ncbi:MAG: hypothetical protein H6Q90_3607 [Deltaproteobacteria bacterium]|nr:hypothetical protein [Deltaproteobacteria bacterium]